ncbi:MAG: glycerophosphodiester phosphodiesterase [Frankiaceae bacterium]|nr:glycerophosphodiester phosphodiesterase [Frankiaceae bacterium]
MKYRFAHRGGAHGPENTLQTFADALARGADGLETDAWISLDGAVVLDHDGVDPASREPIAQVRRDQLPAHMPTLDELYARCGTDFDLAIDVKTPAVARAIAEVAAAHDADHRLWLVAPQAAHLEALDLGEAHRAVTIRGNVIRSRHRHRAIADAKATGIEAINARWMWWNDAIVREVHHHGMLAFGYDAQRAFSLDRCRRLGLDGIFSDHVDRMMAATD